MAFMDNFTQIMQTISYANQDMDKFMYSHPKIEDKLSLFLDNKINSKQQENDALQYLKDQKTKLLSIGTDYTNTNTSNSSTNSRPISRASSVPPSTPNRFNKHKPKLRYSSKKKSRPTIKRTPLRINTIH
eukprot:154995_1